MGVAPEMLPPGVRLMGFAAVPSLSLDDGGEQARSAMAEPKVSVTVASGFGPERTRLQHVSG